MHLTPFAVPHLAALYGDDPPPGLDPAWLARLYATGGPAFSALDAAGQVRASGGLVFVMPGAAYAWLVTRPPFAGAERLWLARTARQFLQELARLHRLRRVEADVDPAEPRAVRFLDWLAFEAEGLKRQFGPHGETYVAMAWLPTEDK